MGIGIIIIPVCCIILMLGSTEAGELPEEDEEGRLRLSLEEEEGSEEEGSGEMTCMIR